MTSQTRAAEDRLVRMCTRKRRYTDRTVVKAALRSARRVPIRYYPCPNCHGWHLTSKPKQSTPAGGEG